MNVLSLFNGISCGRLALERAGIKVDKYYSSEIDKYALAVDAKNYPDNIQLGDIREIDTSKLEDIDMVIGGSSCQNFSIAGNKKGMATESDEAIVSLEQYLELKEKGTKFIGYSYLFWEYVRILKELKPRFFLLENVKMANKWKDVITNALKEIYPDTNVVEINSSLVSAQSRKRLYWSNIPNITQPEDKKIFIKDILEEKVDDKYFLSEKLVNGFLNSKSVWKDRFKPISDGNSKSPCLTARYYKMGKSDPYILNKPIRLGHFNQGGQGDRVYSTEAKSVTLSAHGGGRGAKTGLYYVQNGIRKLTPIECERLQTLPDNWTEGISNTQRYKCLGNCWTVDVIVHIFNCMKECL